jgi:N-acetylglucosaminyl-diphospho-decaprenol L-rhamnosyltransferase
VTAIVETQRSLVATPTPAPANTERATPRDLTVAIVSYRSIDLLARCLATFAAATEGLTVDLHVVENGTGEDVEALVARTVPGARCTTLRRSIAFSAAVNLALRDAGSRHVALLNPDTLLGARSLTRLVAHLDSDPRVGVVGPRVYDDAGCSSIQRSWRSFPSFATALFHRHSWLSRCFPGNRFTRRYLNLDRSPDAIQPTDWVSGCCMVVRRDLFAAVGGLDERFPMFFEDVDLCRAAAARGMRVDYVPTASIVHFVGGSRRRAALRSVWLRHRSMARYLWKHHGRTDPRTWLMVAGVWVRFAATACVARRQR